MKYFNPSYWFKLWILSAPLFNSENQGIYAKSIDNQKIKDWVSKDNNSLESINEQSNLTNWSTNYQPYSLNETNQNITPFYQTELETSTHKHRYEKSRNKRQHDILDNQYFNIYNVYKSEYLYSPNDYFTLDSKRRHVFTWREKNKKIHSGLWKLSKYEGNQYTIYNIGQNEYLYAADFSPFDSKRGSVFTWREKNKNVNQGFWKLEKKDDPFAVPKFNKIDIKKKNEELKEKIKYVNNHFFYRFDLNTYDEFASDVGFFTIVQNVKIFSKVLIEDLGNYASDWEEFEKKFPEIEFINLIAKGGVSGGYDEKKISLDSFKISTFLKKSHFKWKEELDSDYVKDLVFVDKPTVSKKAWWGLKENVLEELNFHRILKFVNSQFGTQASELFIRIHPENNKLFLENIIILYSGDSAYYAWGSIHYNSVRILGEVDFNPLFSQMLDKLNTIRNLYNAQVSHLNKLDKEEKLTYKDVIKNQLINNLVQWKIDYFQSIKIIYLENKTDELQSQINNINLRLNSSKIKTCVENIAGDFIEKPNSAFDKTAESIVDGNHINIIFKATIKSITANIVKGPLIGIFDCIFKPFISRKRREIFDINNLEEKPNKTVISNELQNITKWTDEFTKSINNEQNLPINNKTNFIANNITSL